MSNDQNNGDGGFYKGLVYGALLGLGIAWFLGTKEGKNINREIAEKGEEFIEKAKESINESLEEDFVEVNQGAPKVNEKSESPPSRFFEEV